MNPVVQSGAGGASSPNTFVNEDTQDAEEGDGAYIAGIDGSTAFRLGGIGADRALQRVVLR